MLAVLLLARNTPVSRGQIIEAVWGDNVPSSAVNLVQTYVAGLRRALEPTRARRAPAELLTSVGDGYLLSVEPGALDLDVFDRQVLLANRMRAAGDLAGAAVELDDALALFRAEPLGGVSGLFCDVERGRLVERRLAVLAAGGRKPEALKLLMRLEALTARGDTSQMESLLVRATEIDPDLASAQLQLGMFYDGEGAYDQAMARYRLVLDREPQNVIALNNLAYALAVQKKQPAEALPLAERAYRVSRLAIVADTLGWIHHLLGRNDLAMPLLEQSAAATDRGDVLVHAAVVALELGDATRARKHLDAALARDPKLAERSDVKALRDRLRVPAS